MRNRLIHLDLWISQALWQFYLSSPPSCLRGHHLLSASNLLRNSLTGAQTSRYITANLEDNNPRWFGLPHILFCLRSHLSSCSIIQNLLRPPILLRLSINCSLNCPLFLLLFLLGGLDSSICHSTKLRCVKPSPTVITCP